MPKTALLIGSTGLIGSQLLKLLLNDDRYSKVIAVGRKQVNQDNPKIVAIVCELNHLSNYSVQFKADDVFCCLGTTMRQAKSKEAFRAVDFDAPLALARISKEQGAKKFLLVTALGANNNSPVFYNQVKGEIEIAISQIDFESFHVFRPSLLLGPRKEQRSTEESAKAFFKVFGLFIPKKYKAIESSKVAQAMLDSAQKEDTGFFIHESKEMLNHK